MAHSLNMMDDFNLWVIVIPLLFFLANGCAIAKLGNAYGLASGQTIACLSMKSCIIIFMAHLRYEN